MENYCEKCEALFEESLKRTLSSYANIKDKELLEDIIWLVMVDFRCRLAMMKSDLSEPPK